MKAARRTSRFACAAGALALLFALGCETPPDSAERGLTEDVKLADLVPAAPTGPAAPTATAESASAESVVTDAAGETETRPSFFADHRLVVRRMVFGRPAPRLRLALDTLHPPDIDALTLRTWHDNGLRIGEIERGRLELLLANVPDAMGFSDIVHTGPAHWVPQVLLQRVDGALPVDYVHPDGRVERLGLRGGRQQLMMRLEQPDPSSPDRSLRLALLPHHYKQAHTLLPRSPLEKDLDGRPFYDLLVKAPAPTRRAWVIWADLPLPPHAPEPQAEIDAEAEDLPVIETDAPPRTPDEAEPPKQRPLPDVFDKTVDVRKAIPLGEALMAGTRGKDPAQLMLIILVDGPAASPAPADANDASVPADSEPIAR